MKVKDVMQKQVFTVEPDDMVDRVFLLLNHEKIRHLPVVERKNVVGIVSDRDLYKVLGPRSRRDRIVEERDATSLYVIPRKVRHIMRRGVICIGPEEEVGKAALLMARKKIGALPVVSGRKLMGIVTSTDLLRTLAQMCRTHEQVAS